MRGASRSSHNNASSSMNPSDGYWGHGSIGDNIESLEVIGIVEQLVLRGWVKRAILIK